ncbi:MAG: glycosyltransferase family 2 protein [Pikeienuella sp.]
MQCKNATPSPRLPVSAFLITLDEAERLPRAIASLDFCDEIVVVDSGSRDGTQEIARAAGARVVHRDWEGYGPQKAHAERLCRNDWVLNIDADEWVTPQLAAELKTLFAENAPPPAAYRLPILTVYPGDERPRPFADDYRVVRFYHRAIGRYRAHPVFDRVEVVGRARPLRGPLWHAPVLDWAHFVAKENRYTSFQAVAARRDRRWLRLRLVVEFPLAFLKFYFLRRHVFGGSKGFAFAMIAAFGRWLRIAKLLSATSEPPSQSGAAKRA